MKRILLLSLGAGMSALIFSSYASGPWQAGHYNRTGIAGTVANCSTGGCHSANTSNTTVSIQVLNPANQPVSSYTPGAVYTITITGSNTSSLPKFGFQSTCVKMGTSAQAGTFSATGSVSVRNSTPNLVEHNTPISGSGGNYTASYTWTAPPAGTGSVTVHAILNAVNGNGSDNGDQPNVAKVDTLTETPGTTGVNAMATLKMDVFPNPALNILHISLGALPHAACRISVLDMAGRVVKRESVNAVNGDARINTESLQPGQYAMIVEQGGQRYVATFSKQ